MTDPRPNGSLARRVTAFTAACVLISNVIGTGIFGTTGFMAADLGRPWLVLLLWAIGGAFALLGALCYAELGASHPRAGGEYVYIGRAFGPLPGFLSGWTSLTIGFSAAIASSAHLFGGYVRGLFPVLAPPPDAEGSWQSVVARASLLELALVWALTAVHVAGAGPGGLLQRVLTVIKVGAIVAFFAGGVLAGGGDWSHLARSDPAISPGIETIVVSFMYVSFSYTGWNAACYIAEEIVEPERNLPRAMLGGTLVVTALYLAVNVAYFYALPVSGLAAEPVAPVGHKTAEVLFGSGVGSWFTAMLSLSIMGAASAMTWAGPRVYFAMARDGVFPRAFAATGGATGVPARAIVLQGIWTSVLVVTGSFQALVLYATFALTVFAGLAVAAVLVLRVRDPERARPYRVPAHPWPAVLYLAVSGAIVWGALVVNPEESLWGVVTVAAGIPFYLLWRPRAPRGETPQGAET